jgi:hypothetical protein
VTGGSLLLLTSDSQSHRIFPRMLHVHARKTRSLIWLLLKIFWHTIRVCLLHRARTGVARTHIHSSLSWFGVPVIGRPIEMGRIAA